MALPDLMMVRTVLPWLDLAGIAAEEPDEPVGAARVGGDLCVEIAVAEMRRARVEEEHLPEIRPPRAGIDELHRREADSLLIDARRIARLAAWNASADIGMVRHRGGEADQAERR